MKKLFLVLNVLLLISTVGSVYSALNIETVENPHGYSAEFADVKKVVTDDKRVKVKKGGEYEIAQDVATIEFRKFVIPSIKKPLKITVFRGAGKRGKTYYLYEQGGYVQVTNKMPMKGDKFTLRITKTGQVEVSPIGVPSAMVEEMSESEEE